MLIPLDTFLTPHAAKRFTKQHEYVIYDDQTNIGTFGITNHAQNSLGDVVFVELPTIGSVVKQGGENRSISRDTLFNAILQNKLAPLKVSRLLQISTHQSLVTSNPSTTSLTTSQACSTNLQKTMVSVVYTADTYLSYIS